MADLYAKHLIVFLQKFSLWMCAISRLFFGPLPSFLSSVHTERMAKELLALLQVQSYFFTSLPLSGRAWQICVPSSKYFRCRRASQSPMCSPFLFKVYQTLHCRKVHSTRKNSLLAKDLIIHNSISWLLSTRDYKSTSASFHILCSQTAISFRYFTTTPLRF